MQEMNRKQWARYKRFYCARWTAATSILAGFFGLLVFSYGLIWSPIALLLPALFFGAVLLPVFITDCPEGELTWRNYFRAALGGCLVALISIPFFLSQVLLLFKLIVEGKDIAEILDGLHIVVMWTMLMSFFSVIASGLVTFPITIFSAIRLQIAWSRKCLPQVERNPVVAE